MNSAVAQPATLDVETAAPESSVSVAEQGSPDRLAHRVLLGSFIAAVLLAVGGFVVVAVYLFQYLHHSFATFDTDSMNQLSKMDFDTMQSILLARAGLWKFILQSCGIMAGVAFGFLGFALFLLGVKGDMDAAYDDSRHKVQLTRLAPGSFVMLIAAVLIGLCCLFKVELKFNPTVTTEIRHAGAGPTNGDDDRRQSAATGGNGASNDPYYDPTASPFSKPAPADANASAKASSTTGKSSPGGAHK
jgi:hypothetical protein